ncbi:toll-like receptor 2 [Glandiceps talaboti]
MCPAGLWVTCRSYRRIPTDLPMETVALHLEYNQITTIEGPSLSYLKKLRLINLSHNKLYDGSLVTAFQGLDFLEHLYMNHNTLGFTVISDELLKPLKNLRKLQIRSSNIDKIAENAFQENIKLERVYLGDNRITAIPEQLFRGLPNLRLVDISHNSLQSLPKDMLDSSMSIKFINLESNRLISISEDVGLQKLKKLAYLHIENNPFDCGCDLLWFRRWISNKTAILGDSNFTKCTSGQTLLQFNPNELKCAHSTLMITLVSVTSLIIFCILCVVVFTNRWRLRYVIFMVNRKIVIHGYKAVPGDDNHHRYDAFISHSHKDQDWIYDVIYPTLENPPYNYKLCLDFRDFQVGELIVNNILKSVEESRKTVFILTKEFIESEWCYFELEMVRQKMFDEHRDAAILVLKDDIPAKKMPGLLKYFMRKGNHITWSENVQGQRLFWAKLDAALKCHHKNIV